MGYNLCSVYTSLSPGRAPAKYGSDDEGSSGEEWGDQKGNAKKGKKKKADEPPVKKRKKDPTNFKNTGSKRTMVIGTVPDVQVWG